MYYRNKLFIIGLLVFVALLAISGASAAENTTDIATVDSDMSSNEDIIKQVNDREIICVNDNGTFNDLQSKIDAAGVGGVVNLENKYIYDDSFSNNGITISNPITINGNGFTINGMGQSRIFDITSLNNVILTL